MRKIVRNIRLVLFTSLSLGAMLALSGPVYAQQWSWTHGNGGVVQDQSLISPGVFHLGWGLDFVQSGGRSNWVHFAIPTVGSGENGVQFIGLKFSTGSADAAVTQIDVYDGDINFQTITGRWTGYNDIQLDLGQVWQLQRGLGISIGIGAGVESMSHQFQFMSAGALFEPFSMVSPAR